MKRPATVACGIVIAPTAVLIAAGFAVGGGCVAIAGWEATRGHRYRTANADARYALARRDARTVR